MTFKAPVIRYDEVGDYAQKFLRDYHPDLTLPVPIEGIIEFDLDLYIAPFPNLYRVLGQSGWLSANRTTIFIDEYQQDNFWEKYRFTLAHEVGHYIMHEGVYDGPDFKVIEDQIRYLFSRDKHQVNWYEKQGDWFAGHVLVPTQRLEELCRGLVEPYQSQFGNEQLPSEGFKLFAATELAGVFQVNQPVIEIRIDREGLVGKLLNTSC